MVSRSPYTKMRILPVPLLRDNYGYLIIDDTTGEAAIVDPGEVEPVLDAVSRAQVRLTKILNTHHHWDHTGGNEALLRAIPGLEVAGYARDRERIPGINRFLDAGDQVSVGTLEGRVLLVPCHTRGHVAYLFGPALFSGDTLFVGGCGRFTEGTAAQMFDALFRVFGALPRSTLLYCGHEYALKNLRFAATLEPDNLAIANKTRDVMAARARGLPSVPTSLNEEWTYNPFLRVDQPELVASVKAIEPGVRGQDPVAVMAVVRRLKDAFS